MKTVSRAIDRLEFRDGFDAERPGTVIVFIPPSTHKLTRRLEVVNTRVENVNLKSHRGKHHDGARRNPASNRRTHHRGRTASFGTGAGPREPWPRCIRDLVESARH